MTLNPPHGNLKALTSGEKISMRFSHSVTALGRLHMCQFQPNQNTNRTRTSAVVSLQV